MSDRPTAIPLLTSLGTHLVNPAITSVGKGVDQARYQQLEAHAQASPSAQLSVPGLKATVRGSEILGLSYDDGTKVIYGEVADAYYTGGASAAFDVPSLPSVSAASSPTTARWQAMRSSMGCPPRYLRCRSICSTLPAISASRRIR